MSKFFLVISLVFSLLLFLIPQLVFAAGWLAARLFHGHLAWRPFLWAGLILVTVWWGLYSYGHFWGRFRFEVKPVEYRNSLLPPAFEGYRIVQISDLHMDGWAAHEAELSRVVQSVNDLQPDLIVFTGDLVSFNYHELESLGDTLARLRARDGVLSILGNHDYDPYEPGLSPRQRQALVDSLVRWQGERLGWRVLLNEHVVLRRGADSLAVIGVENQSCGVHQVIRRGRLTEAMAGTEGMFRILLSHDPSHWRAEVLPETDIPLTLSGHTHAMQFRVLGFTPSRWAYPECDGRYDEGGQTLYVNIGLGGTLPTRIGATPEVTLFTLHR